MLGSIDILMKVAGGLGIFLYGMKVMSGAVEEIAGHRLRRLISKMTSNIYKGIAVGALVTSIIQSSSVTTVMAVGFVNAGLMTLRQAVGIILGANIGTTITGWILALEVTRYGLPMAGWGALFYLFGRDNRRRKRALSIMGLGMIFLGLTFMKSGVKPLKDMPEFIGFFSLFAAYSYRGVVLSALMGTLLTFVLQSSSATVGITIALATQGIISAETSVALVLGENIGTTMTAYLASLGSQREAKRVAYAHILIKIAGVVMILPAFYLYMDLMSMIIDPQRDIARFIALSHTVFNCGLVVFFIPLVEPLIRVLNRMGKGREKERREYINECLYKVPSVTLEMGRQEILQMIERFLGDIEVFLEILKSRRIGGLAEKIFQGEVYQDEKKDAIHQEMTGLLNCVSSGEVLKEARLLMKMGDEVESMGDYGASLAKITIKAENMGIVIGQWGVESIEACHRDVVHHLRELKRIFKNEAYWDLKRLKERCNRISMTLSEVDPLEEAEYSDHIVMEVLAKYRRINRHIIYIIEALQEVYTNEDESRGRGLLGKFKL